MGSTIRTWSQSETATPTSTAHLGLDNCCTRPGNVNMQWPFFPPFALGCYAADRADDECNIGTTAHSRPQPVRTVAKCLSASLEAPYPIDASVSEYPAHTGVPKPGDDPIHIHTRRRHLVQPAIPARLTVMANKEGKKKGRSLLSSYGVTLLEITALSLLQMYSWPSIVLAYQRLSTVIYNRLISRRSKETTYASWSCSS